jgi:hypothetical protein
MSDPRWEDARRLEAWAGETRVNLIRAVALVAFYGYHLLNVYVFSPYGGVGGDELKYLQGAYNLKVTGVVLAWTMAVGALYICLSRRWVPPALKYVATSWDLAMISALLLADAKAGPHSPLVFLYFLVVAAAPLRLSLRLVYAATLGTMAAATLMMGCYVFGLIGMETYYTAGDPWMLPRTSPPWMVPRTSEVIFLLSLGAAGLLAGQVVRQARRLVQGYPVTVESEREAA